MGTLSERTEWWAAGVEVGSRSPVIGLGLTSGTRFEVFPSIDRDVTPNLHGTWVEAIVGTGIVGVTLLVAAFGSATGAAHRIGRRRHELMPILLFAGILINSLTHTTVELASLTFLLLVLVGSEAQRRETLPLTDQRDASSAGARLAAPVGAR